MSQNRSNAVMATRIEPHDSLDDFPTQPWATRALAEYVLQPAGIRTWERSVWEPACNRGHMVRPLNECFSYVDASDVHDYGCGFRQQDYLMPFRDDFIFDWVISNPPFRLAEQFIERAFADADEGHAFIVRTSFLESVGRYKCLFSVNPPTIVAQFSERVPMVKGRLTATGSTATAYCWLVWIRHEQGTRFQWIPPCRKRLERPGDYADFDPSEDSRRNYAHAISSIREKLLMEGKVDPITDQEREIIKNA